MLFRSRPNHILDQILHEMLRFRHLDYEHLREILFNHREEYDNVFIVTESIFSMDGDVADLQELCDLKREYDTFLYVDEAHAVGVRGTNGLGCCEEQGCIDDIDFIVGTFGKAFASYGAFVVCDEMFREFLVNTQRSLIFTTALDNKLSGFHLRLNIFFDISGNTFLSAC